MITKPWVTPCLFCQPEPRTLDGEPLEPVLLQATPPEWPAGMAWEYCLPSVPGGLAAWLYDQLGSLALGPQEGALGVWVCHLLCGLVHRT